MLQTTCSPYTPARTSFSTSDTDSFNGAIILSSFNDSFSCVVSFAFTTICKTKTLQSTVQQKTTIRKNNSWLVRKMSQLLFSFLPVLCTTMKTTKNVTTAVFIPSSALHNNENHQKCHNCCFHSFQCPAQQWKPPKMSQLLFSFLPVPCTTMKTTKNVTTAVFMPSSALHNNENHQKCHNYQKCHNCCFHAFQCPAQQWKPPKCHNCCFHSLQCPAQQWKPPKMSQLLFSFLPVPCTTMKTTKNVTTAVFIPSSALHNNENHQKSTEDM